MAYQYNNMNYARFCKIILLITSRFLVQSYILSMAIKSLMYKFVSKYQHFTPYAADNGMFRDLEEQYYRGLEKQQEVLSFTQATLYFPIVLISAIYLPAVLYVVHIQISLHGWRAWFGKTFENPLFFVFPIFTSICFNENAGKINIDESTSIEENASTLTSRNFPTVQNFTVQRKQTENIQTNYKNRMDSSIIEIDATSGSFNNIRDSSTIRACDDEFEMIQSLKNIAIKKYTKNKVSATYLSSYTN